MADKNRNGIPDERERFKPGQRVGPVPDSLTGQDRVRAGVNPFFKDLETSGNPFGFLVNPIRQGLNFFGDIPSGLGGFQDESRENRIGTGIGDSIFGVQSGYYDQLNKASNDRKRAAGARFSKGPAGPQGTSPLSFQEALQQALGLIGGQGDGGGIPFVNYDPQRESARSNAAEADARIGAMYRQLTDSINADAPAIQQAYQQAIDSTNTGSNQAQQNIQQANDVATSRNNEVLANLGIQDANAQIIGQGRDANTATAAQVADMAAAQQAATNNLTANQASSVQQNRSIGSASSLEGNLQRAQNQARLQSLLAQIDAEEQGQNSSIAAQNQSRQGSNLSTALSLASQLYGYNREDMDREAQMQQAAMEMMQPSGAAGAVQLLSQLLNKNGGLFGSEEALDQDQLIKLLIGFSR